MYHLVARGADRRLLFRTWVEGLALWRRVVRGVPGLIAFTVMPDHLHLVHPLDVRRSLAQVLSGFARWRNHARGESGRVFEPLPRAEPLADADKRRRTVRYVHLNPCRARLTRDPLAWPLSTHRDAVGLALPAAVRAQADPIRFHAWVSADPSVAVGGTALPDWTVVTTDLEAVADAVSAVARASVGDLGRRGPTRALFLRASAELCPGATREQVGRRVGVSRVAAWTAVGRDADLAAVARALGDPRFGPLLDGDLRQTPGWERYRGRG